MTQWEFLVPNLPVRDVPAAQGWYRDVLGLGVNWNVREFTVRDPGGNLLRIGTAVEEPVQREQLTYPGQSD